MTETTHPGCDYCDVPFEDDTMVDATMNTAGELHYRHSVEHGGCPRNRDADLAIGKALAEEGAAAAFNSLDERLSTWRKDAETALDDLIRTGEDFSSDDVAERAGDPPKPNAMGGLMHTRRGLMEAVGYMQTTRKSGHARVIRVWRGI